MRNSSFLLFIAFLLAGCAVPSSRWRQDAYSRFNTAVTAGSQQYAPEETESIRQALALAEHYEDKKQYDDAERLFQLSCQKSQLLYRNLVLSKIRQGSTLVVQNPVSQFPEEIALASESVSIRTVLQEAELEQRTAADFMSDAAPEAESLLNKPDIQRVEMDASTKFAGATITVPEAGSLNVQATGTSNAASERHTSTVSEQDVSPEQKKSAQCIQSTSQALPQDRNRTGSRKHDPGRTTIYLTFDDGPSRLTLPIASYLSSQGIGATFFALGNNIKGHEHVIRETVALGHRVGNHTLSHDLKKLKKSLQQGHNEIEKTAAIVDKLGGDGKMVRIPYGAVSKNLVTTVASEGGQIFDWDINSLDSSRRGAKDHSFIERAVLQQLQKSGKRHIVLLFHDGAGHEATLTAIRKLVPRLRQERYRFGLLSRSDRVAQSRAGKNPLP